MDQRRATRLDEDGMKVVVEFTNEVLPELFGIRTDPADEPVGAALLCSPFGIEHVRNYRNQKQLAYRLARAGVAVQRFDYLGSGNSPGSPESLTFDSMLEDTLRMAELVSDGIAGPLAFIGIRLGGLVAAAAAERYPGAPVALWEPIVDGSSYFRQLQPWASSEPSPSGTASQRDGTSPDSEAAVDVFGYPLLPALVESAEGRVISPLAADHEVLLAQIGRRDSLRGEYDQLVQGWRESSVAVTVHVVTERTRWWIPGTTVEVGESIMLGHDPFIDFTAGWLLERIQRRASPDG